MLYSCQAWNLTKAQKLKCDGIYRGFLRKMLRNGYKHTVSDDNGQIRCFISNAELYSKTKTQSLEDFLEKQFLKYQAHIARMPNNKLQKQIQSRVSTDHSRCIWTKSGNLLGCISAEQTRRLMLNKSEFYSVLDSRYGNRRARQAPVY